MPRLNNDRVNCVCGVSYLSSSRARHMRSSAHVNATSHTGGVVNTSEHEQPWDIVQSATMQYGQQNPWGDINDDQPQQQHYPQQQQQIFTTQQQQQLNAQMDWYNNTYVPTGQLINAGNHTEPTSNYLSNLRRRDYTVLNYYNSSASTLLRNLNRYDTEYMSQSKETYNVFSTTDGTNVQAYFDDIKEPVNYLLYNYMYRYDGSHRILKYNISLYVEYLSPEDEPMVIAFQARNKIVVALNQLDNIYNIITQELELKIQIHELRGSGFIFKRILKY